MKPCSEFTRWRRKALAGTLTPAEAEAFAEHRRQCSACEQAYGQALLLDGLWHQARERKAPEHFNQGVWDRIHALETALPAKPGVWGRIWGAAGFTAALAVLGFAAYSVWQLPPAKVTRTAALATSAAGTPGLRLEPRKNAAARAFGQEPVVAAGLKPAKRVREFLPEEKQAALPPPGAAPAAVPAAAKGVFPAGLRSAYRPESLAPAAREAEVPGSGQRKAAGGFKLQGAGPGTPGLLPGGVQVRPNTIRPGRSERVLLEVNPEMPGRLEARIYTREGRLVRTLVDTDVPAGYRCWEWDGTNDNREKVSGGIYLMQVRGNVPEQKFKLAVIR